MFAPLWLRQFRNHLFGRPSSSSWRKTPPAAVRRRVRPSLEPLEDRLAPSADTVLASATSFSTPFSENQQNLTLTANVSDTTTPATTVSEGTVTFTVEDSNGNAVGSPVQGNVSNGTASASFALPSDEAAGNYTIAVNYNDSAGNFSDGGDTPGALTVNPAGVLVAASNASATPSTASQSVTLTASVTDDSIPSDTVGEGTVTFTVEDSNGNTVGSPVQGNVSNGTASANFTLPANTVSGSYAIAVSYSDSTGNFSDDGTDTIGTLTDSSASTTTTASSTTTGFSTSAQDVTLSATVTSSAGTVNEGSVNFTLFDSNGNTIGTATAGTVSNGQASVSYVLPGGTAAGSYSIEAAYSDSAGTFAASSDDTQTLTANAASTITTASSTAASFSTSVQDVTLSATVTSSAGTVNEGSVNFTLFDSNGNTIGTTTAGTVSNGQASVSYLLPGGTAAGSYSILADYSDSAGNFTASSDDSQTLTVNGAASASTSLSLTAVSIVPNLSNLTAQVTLTAQVSNPADVVGEGVVSFTLAGVSGQGSVMNGTASVQLVVPLQDVLNTSNVTLSYSDDAPSASFANSSTSATLSMNLWNALLPSSLTFAADGSEQIQVQMAGQSTVGFAYSASGLLTQINVASQSLPVTYTNVSGDVVMSTDGVPWQLAFLNSDGQYQGSVTLSLAGDGSVDLLIFNSSNEFVGEVPS